MITRLPSIVGFFTQDITSSGFQLIQTALDLKLEYSGRSIGSKPLLPFKRDCMWDYPSVCDPDSILWITEHIPILLQWAKDPNPEEEELQMPNYVYPDEDLLPILFDGYFNEINPFMPLLHRPTFENSVAVGLHYADPMFGAVVLLVCAHGARFCEDPRVLSDGTDSPRSAGWRWYEQVSVFRQTLIRRTTLHELQMFAVRHLVSLPFNVPQSLI